MAICIPFVSNARLGPPLAALSLTLATLAVPGASTSWANAGPAGEVVGCKAASDGTLRIVDPSAGQKCSSSESRITWNRRGDTGPAGRNSVGTVVRRSATYAPATHPGRMTVRCAEGTRALSWGFSFNRRGSRVVDAGPLPDGAGWWIQPGRMAGYPSKPSADERVTVYVLCAPAAAFAPATASAGPSSGVRVITACRASGGVTRIISPPARCRTNETTLTWADKGRRGGVGAGPLAHRVTVSSTRVADSQALVACPDGTLALTGWYRTNGTTSGHGPLEDGAGWQVIVLNPAAPITVSVTCAATRAVVEPVEEGPSLSGCRNPKTGAFRLLAGGSCRASERLVTWRQRGRTGFTGASGQLLDYVAVQDARFEPPAAIPGTVQLSAQCDPGQTRLGGGAIAWGPEMPMSLPSSDGASWRASLYVRNADTEAWAVAICARS